VGIIGTIVSTIHRPARRPPGAPYRAARPSAGRDREYRWHDPAR